MNDRCWLRDERTEKFCRQIFFLRQFWFARLLISALALISQREKQKNKKQKNEA